MSSLIITEHPIRACCATCRNWCLSSYLVFPPRQSKHSDVYCTSLRMSLQPYMGKLTQTTCQKWEREMVDTAAVELWQELCHENI